MTLTASLLVLATNGAYVAAGWTIVVVVLAVYSVRLALRGRRLAGLVAPERRRWSEADDTTNDGEAR